MWPFGRARGGDDLGRRGERLARKMLQRKGLKILARNYRCPAGEVDLIAFDPSTRRDLLAETVVFVEVKTRSSNRYTDPSSAVDRDKQRRIEKVAGYYLSHHPAEDLNLRYDVVSVVAPDGQKPRIEHIENAF